MIVCSISYSVFAIGANFRDNAKNRDYVNFVENSAYSVENAVENAILFEGEVPAVLDAVPSLLGSSNGEDGLRGLE